MTRRKQEQGPATDVWYVYLLRCADGSLDNGITKDLQRRCRQHEASFPAASPGFSMAHRMPVKSDMPASIPLAGADRNTPAAQAHPDRRLLNRRSESCRGRAFW